MSTGAYSPALQTLHQMYNHGAVIAGTSAGCTCHTANYMMRCKQALINTDLFISLIFIRFTASVFRKLLSVYVFSYFPFGFEGRIWDLIVSVPDHCLSFYFARFIFPLLF